MKIGEPIHSIKIADYAFRRHDGYSSIQIVKVMKADVLQGGDSHKLLHDGVMLKNEVDTVQAYRGIIEYYDWESVW